MISDVLKYFFSRERVGKVPKKKISKIKALSGFQAAKSNYLRHTYYRPVNDALHIRHSLITENCNHKKKILNNFNWGEKKNEI